MNVTEQVRQGRLVCPVSRQELVQEGDELVTCDGSRRYPVVSGVPILHADPERIYYFRSCFPGGRAGRLFWLAARLCGRLLLPLDRRLNARNEAVILASSVFARAVRPLP